MSANKLTPTWLKATAVIGVIWYGFGLLQFYLGISLDTAQAITEGAITPGHAAAIDDTPMAIWAAFALASFAGLVGAILLFGGNPKTKTAFAVSLASAVAYYLWIYGLSGTGAERPSAEIGIAAVVILVTLGFTILSRKTT